jgi:hypothetical protein
MAKMEQTYKAKYQQLKMQYMNAVDTAFRLGFEQGKQQAELDQAAQQQQQAQEMAQAAMAPPGVGGPPGSEGQAPPAANGQPGEDPQIAGQEEMEPDSEHPDGSELDQHIAKLESLLGKADTSPEDMMKALSEIKSLRKAHSQSMELRKSAQAIKEISKALHKPGFKLSVQASHNMNDNAKKAVTMQHKIVDDVMRKWEEEEAKAVKGIHEIIQVEGLIKKEE